MALNQGWVLNLASAAPAAQLASGRLIFV